jgi:putative flippase GtrA
MISKITTLLNRYLILRYIISGGFSSTVDIALFSFFIEIVGLHYIISAAISVTISFVIRFYLQKVFAFKDRNLDIHRQIVMYSILYALSLVMTTALLYLFIDKLHIWYVLAQIMAIGLVAIASFFVYRHIIFRKVDLEISHHI